MKIGILSDVHGNTQPLPQALERFRARAVQAVVVCGDIGSAKVVEMLAEGPWALYLTAGNMDRHWDLQTTARRLGVCLAMPSVEVPIGGGQYLSATHGHREEVLDELIAGGQFPYVCHGHTHRRRDERLGQVRVINPGAIHQGRDRPGASAAILDTASDALEFLDL